MKRFFCEYLLNIQHKSKYSYALAVFLIVLFCAMFFSRHIKLKSDFKFLLPENSSRVLDLEDFRKNFKQKKQISIALKSNKKQNLVKATEELISFLKSQKKDFISKLDYSSKDIETFFEKNRFLYVDVEDIVELRGRLKKKIDYEKEKSNPFFFQLDDEEPEFEYDDILEKYENKAKKDYGVETKKSSDEKNENTQSYYFSKDQTLSVIKVQPNDGVQGIEKTKIFLNELKEKVGYFTRDNVNFTNVSIYYAGSLAESVQEHETIVEDISSTLLLCLSLVALIILLYFMRIRAVFILIIPLLYAVVLMVAFAYLKISYLNSITAFLISIIVGNGVNTGILVLARFYENRALNISSYDAFKSSLQHLFWPTCIATVTTAVAFLVLIYSDLNSMKHFGIIGSFGVVAAWLLTYMTLPNVFFLFDAIKKDKAKKRWSSQSLNLFSNFYSKLFKNHKVYLSVFSVLAICAMYFVVDFMPRSIEYDFSKLRNKKNVSQKAQSNIFKQVNDIFKKVNPTFAYSMQNHNLDICEKITAMDAVQKPVFIDRCNNLKDILPDKQDEKLKEIEKINTLLNDKAIAFVKDQTKIEDLKKELKQLRVIKNIDLPEKLTNNFTHSEDGSLINAAMVYPKRGLVSGSAKNLIAYAKQLFQLKQTDASLKVASQSMIFAGILQKMNEDGPIASLIAFICVVFAVLLLFGLKRSAFYIVIGLILGLLQMFFLQALFAIKFNFINFVAIPMSYGLGVDYMVNLFSRLQQKSDHASAKIKNNLANTASAIFLCSMTTSVSYISLMTANSMALNSFGKLALMGEISFLLVSLIFLPSVFLFFNRSKA